jgi:hypothetical protein
MSERAAGTFFSTVPPFPEAGAHGFICIVAFLGAYFLRFEFSIPPHYFPVIREAIPVLTAGEGGGVLRLRPVPRVVAYVGIRTSSDRGAAPSVVAVLRGRFFLYPLPPFPIDLRLDCILSFLFVMGARYLIRFGRETFERRNHPANRRVLVVGAGAAGQMIVREIRANPSLGMREIGFVDDDPLKMRVRIDGVPVLGNHGDIPRLCEDHRIDEIIIAIPSAPPSRLRHILEHCRDANARARILPGVGDLIDGKVSGGTSERGSPDLSARPVRLDTELLNRASRGRRDVTAPPAPWVGADTQDRRLVARPAGDVRDRGEPAVRLRDGDAERFPASTRPVIGVVRTAAGGGPLGSIDFHRVQRGGVQARAHDEMHPRSREDERAGDAILAEVFANTRWSGSSSFRPTSRSPDERDGRRSARELVIPQHERRRTPHRVRGVRFGNFWGGGERDPIFGSSWRTTGKLTVTAPRPRDTSC